MIQTGAIVSTLYITIVQLKRAMRSDRAFASLQITTSHREIWSHLLTNPSLGRIVDPNPDLTRNPITQSEEYFVIMVVTHMMAVYDAHKEGLHRIYPADMGEFFEFPIPSRVWNEIKRYQPEEFVSFIERLRSEVRSQASTLVNSPS